MTVNLGNGVVIYPAQGTEDDPSRTVIVNITLECIG